MAEAIFQSLADSPDSDEADHDDGTAAKGGECFSSQDGGGSGPRMDPVQQEAKH